MKYSRMYMDLVCPKCTSKDRGYVYSKTPIDCKICAYRILNPTGGKARYQGFKIKKDQTPVD